MYFLLFSCAPFTLDGLNIAWGMPVGLEPSDEHVGANVENSFSHWQQSLPVVSALFLK